MLALIIAVKLVAEIALLAFTGQYVLGRLAGTGRERNFFYQVLNITVKPFVALARLVRPQFVAEKQLPALAFSMLALVWLAATVFKVLTCLQMGLRLCQ